MGVEASHTMAEADVDRMEKYKSMINRVGGKHGIALALIAAIISRESQAENMLDDGWGDYNPGRGAHNAWGLMQVDVNPDGGRHTPEGDWDSEEHLCQGTGILVDFIKRICDKFPDWSREKQLKGGIAAYNMGDGNVHSYGKVDKKQPVKTTPMMLLPELSGTEALKNLLQIMKETLCNVCCAKT